MDIIYKNDTLFVELVGDVDTLTVSEMQKKLFSVLDQYDVENVVINVRGIFNLDRKIFNTVINEYHKNYRGKIMIESK